MTSLVVPAIIRGKVLAERLVPFGGRTDGTEFVAPDPMSLTDLLALPDPGSLQDLYELSFDDILDYLVELGDRLDLSKNAHFREALECSYPLSDQTPSILHRQYAEIPGIFKRDLLYEAVENTIGVPYVEGWVAKDLSDGRRASVRAFGARTVHIVAGNSPFVSAMTVIRNALTRSDAIIKLPSNDPMTSLAIAKTMQEMSPDHPLTRHLSVAYWKGGDTEFESKLYVPANIEKIVAWGGLASVKHVTRYVQPGLELVTLDPKRSATVIGSEAFSSDATVRDVARRLATDIGAINQLACVAARVVFVVCREGDAGIEMLLKLGRLVYDEIQRLPRSISTPAARLDPSLRDNIRAARAAPDFYEVIGGHNTEGAIIVSHFNEPVDFHPSLSGRTANLVPISDYRESIRHMTAYTQTIGVYPDSLREKLRDILSFHGAQRFVTLGYANTGSQALPQDAIEPMRRMVKWIVDEDCADDRLTPQWVEPETLPTFSSPPP